MKPRRLLELELIAESCPEWEFAVAVVAVVFFLATAAGALMMEQM